MDSACLKEANDLIVAASTSLQPSGIGYELFRFFLFYLLTSFFLDVKLDVCRNGIMKFSVWPQNMMKHSNLLLRTRVFLLFFIKVLVTF